MFEGMEDPSFWLGCLMGFVLAVFCVSFMVQKFRPKRVWVPKDTLLLVPGEAYLSQAPDVEGSLIYLLQEDYDRSIKDLIKQTKA